MKLLQAIVFSGFSIPLLVVSSPSTHVVGWGGISLPYEPGSVFTNIGAGWDHGISIRNDGKPFIWGKNWDGEANVPVAVTNVIAAAGGDEHTLALTADGHVHTWGYIYQTSTNPPAGLSNVIAVAAGGNHSLALKADGTVTGWGADWAGQIDPPVGLTNVIAIAAGFDFSIALKADSTVVAWGDYSFAQNQAPGTLHD